MIKQLSIYVYFYYLLYGYNRFEKTLTQSEEEMASQAGSFDIII
jgi:hypothetical protein